MENEDEFKKLKEIVDLYEEFEKIIEEEFERKKEKKFKIVSKDSRDIADK